MTGLHDFVPEEPSYRPRARAAAARLGFELPEYMPGETTYRECPRCGFESFYVQVVYAVYSDGMEPASPNYGCDRCDTDSARLDTEGD